MRVYCCVGLLVREFASAYVCSLRVFVRVCRCVLCPCLNVHLYGEFSIIMYPILLSKSVHTTSDVKLFTQGHGLLVSGSPPRMNGQRGVECLCHVHLCRVIGQGV